MSLALHASLPKLEAAYQFYNDLHKAGECDGGSWVDWYGEVVCDAITLKDRVEVELLDAAGSSGTAGDRYVGLLYDRMDTVSDTLKHTATIEVPAI